MEDLSALPPAEFTRLAHELLAQACPDKDAERFFSRNMAAAKALGLSYVQGLQFVINKRAGLN